MSGALLHNATRQGDAATVRTLLSTSGALSSINYQDADGPLYYSAKYVQDPGQTTYVQIISSDTFAAHFSDGLENDLRCLLCILSVADS